MFAFPRALSARAAARGWAAGQRGLVAGGRCASTTSLAPLPAAPSLASARSFVTRQELRLMKTHESNKRAPKANFEIARDAQSPVVLVAEDGTETDMTFGEAMKLAQQVPTDLVQLGLLATVPVVKIVDKGKHFRDLKKTSKAKLANILPDKQVQVNSPTIAPRDLAMKLDQLKKFVQKGHEVKFTVRDKGEEVAQFLKGVREEIKSVGNTGKFDQTFGQGFFYCVPWKPHDKIPPPSGEGILASAKKEPPAPTGTKDEVFKSGADIPPPPPKAPSPPKPPRHTSGR